jgi:hypothetical protein
MTPEEILHRIKNAIIILKENNPFNVGELTLSSKNDEHLSVTIATRKTALEKISKENAIEELEEAKTLFAKMVEASDDLKSFIKNKEIEYALVFDYGMGSIEICNEVNKKINWVLAK